MPIFTISYRKRNKSNGHDYAPIEQELTAQRCFRLDDALWLGSFDNSATQLHQLVKSKLDRDDPLMVVEITNHFCFSSMNPGGDRWLQANPPQGGIKNPHVPPPVHPPLESAQAEGNRPGKGKK